MRTVFLISVLVVALAIFKANTHRKHSGSLRPRRVCMVMFVKKNIDPISTQWPVSLKSDDVTLNIISGYTKRYVTISHVWKRHDNSTMSDANPQPEGINWVVQEDPPGKTVSICSAIAGIVGYDVAIWMDSLCINQCNNVELASEVERMDDIYANAEATYIILNTVEASAAAYSLYTIIMKNSNVVYKPNPHGGFPEIDCEWSKDDQVKYLESLKILTNDKWFSRCWTLQETVLSKNVYVVTPDKIPVDLRQILLYGNGLNESTKRKFNMTISDKHNALQLHMFNMQDYNSAHYCLYLLRNRECCRDEDIIYSVRGLISYGKQIPVNYKEGQRYVMKRLVETGITHGDLTMLGCLSPYNSAHSYVPELNKRLLHNIKNVANYNFEYFGRVTNNSIQVRGRVIGKVTKVYTKVMHTNNIEYLRTFFNQEDETVFRYCIGNIDGGYNWETRTVWYGKEKTYDKIIYEKIISIELDIDVNKHLSRNNCVFCNQHVNTHSGKQMRASHDGHQSILNDNIFVVQAAGKQAQGDVVIDIGIRNWAGEPAFITAYYNTQKNAYARTGVTHSTIAIAGGRAYEKKREPIIFS